jgi:hypothetical protein
LPQVWRISAVFVLVKKRLNKPVGVACRKYDKSGRISGINDQIQLFAEAGN